MELLKQILNKVLNWVRDVLPTVTAVGSMVYNYMLKRVRNEEKKVAKLKLELELERNKERVEEENRGKSDLDVLDDAIGKGRELRDGKKVPE